MFEITSYLSFLKTINACLRNKFLPSEMVQALYRGDRKRDKERHYSHFPQINNKLKHNTDHIKLHLSLMISPLIHPPNSTE